MNRLLWNWWNCYSCILEYEMGLGWVSILQFWYFYNKLDYYNMSVKPCLGLFCTSYILLFLSSNSREKIQSMGFLDQISRRSIGNSWAFTYCCPIIPRKLVALRSSNMGSWYGFHSRSWLHRCQGLPGSTVVLVSKPIHAQSFCFKTRKKAHHKG